MKKEPKPYIALGYRTPNGDCLHSTEWCTGLQGAMMIETTDKIGTLRRCTLCYHNASQGAYRPRKPSQSKTSSTTVTTPITNTNGLPIGYRTRYGKCWHKNRECNALVNKMILPVYTPGPLRHRKVCNITNDLTPLPTIIENSSRPSSSTAASVYTYM